MFSDFKYIIYKELHVKSNFLMTAPEKLSMYTGYLSLFNLRYTVYVTL